MQTPKKLGTPLMLNKVGVTVTDLAALSLILINAREIIVMNATHRMTVVANCKSLVFCTLPNTSGPIKRLNATTKIR